MADSKFKDLLESIYLSCKGGPGTFTGAKRLFKAAKKKDPSITQKDVYSFLQDIKGYTRHRRAVRKFPTRTYLAITPGEFWQCDLIYIDDMKNIVNQKVHNKPRYALMAIDVFSLVARGAVLFRKRPEDVLKGFKQILDESKRQPSFLQVSKIQRKPKLSAYIHTYIHTYIHLCMN